MLMVKLPGKISVEKEKGCVGERFEVVSRGKI